MDSQIDGVKKKSVKRKSKNKKVSQKIKKEALEENMPDSNFEKDGKKNFLSTIVSFVITAFVASIVVGGGIYLWQENNSKKTINEVKKEKENIAMSFEERLLNLKNKLKGAEDENLELKNINENLKSKVEFLDGAKIKFTSPELGFSFQYPALLGEVKMVIEDGEVGKMFKGVFSGNDKLVFGGVTEDFVIANDMNNDIFLETCGFKTRRGTYYFKSVNAGEIEDYEIAPSNIIELKDGQALIIDSSNFIADDDENVKTFDLGNDLGAVINLDSEDFNGVAFINKDFNKISKEDFEDIIKSIIIN
ncbi:MAG: hypothetical protein ABIA02_02790 [Candidatus Falkowbacteria bacterium]